MTIIKINFKILIKIKEKNKSENILDRSILSQNIISPIGEIEGKLDEYHFSFIIYEGFRYELTTRQVDIPREYRGKK